VIIHRCPARHHVFTSLRGYRTLYSSPEIPREMLDSLESYANRVCMRASAEPEYDIFDLPGGILCIAKRFRAGADHVARPRNCVHTVLLARADVDAITGFNPFFVLLQEVGFFLGPDFEPSTVADHLPRAFLCSEDEFVALLDALDSAPKPEGRVAAVLAALLSGRPTVVIRADDALAAAGLVAFAALLLPPAARSRIGMSSVADLSGMDVRDRTMVLMRRRAESLDEFASHDCVILDFAGSTRHNLPAPSRYVEYVAASLLDEKRRAETKRMLALLMRYPSAGIESDARFERFLEGFKRARRVIGPDGRIRLAAAPRAALDAALAFFRAGLAGAALEIIAQAAAIAVEHDRLIPAAPSAAREKDLRSIIETLVRLLPDANDTSALDIEIPPSVGRRPPTLFFERRARPDLAEWDD